jgi:hypothetical protein
MRKRGSTAVSQREPTTVLTTTMTTVGASRRSTYTTIEPASCLVTPSGCAYGSEGSGFKSLRAHIFGRAQLSGAFRHFDAPRVGDPLPGLSAQEHIDSDQLGRFESCRIVSPRPGLTIAARCSCSPQRRARSQCGSCGKSGHSDSPTAHLRRPVCQAPATGRVSGPLQCARQRANAGPAPESSQTLVGPSCHGVVTTRAKLCGSSWYTSR